MENEAAPTGGRLASPEVIGGKSNRHSGEKGAPQAPFFHALFWVAAGGGTCGEPPRRFLRRGGGVGCCGGGDVASGRALRGRFGRKRRGGRLFFMPFFGVMAGERGGGELGGGEEARWAPFFHAFFWGGAGGRGLPRGRAVVTGFAVGRAGAWKAFGRVAGGAAAFARRFLLFGGWSHRFLGAAVFLGEGIVRGKPCGERRAAESGAADLAFFPPPRPCGRGGRKGG